MRAFIVPVLLLIAALLLLVAAYMAEGKPVTEKVTGTPVPATTTEVCVDYTGWRE